MRRTLLAALAGGLALGATVMALPGSAAKGYSMSSIEGKWGFYEEYHAAGKYATSIGIVRFDGAGECTVEGFRNGGETVELTEFTGTCTYTLKKSGRGTISSPELPDYSFTMADGGSSISFIRTERADMGWGEMRPVAKPSQTVLVGKFSFFHPAEVAGVYDLSVGSMLFDGDGTCWQRYTENGGQYQNGAEHFVQKCEYEVSPSGWGEITGFGDKLIVTDGGNTAFFMHTAQYNVGWGELTRI